MTARMDIRSILFVALVFAPALSFAQDKTATVDDKPALKKERAAESETREDPEKKEEQTPEEDLGEFSDSDFDFDSPESFDTDSVDSERGWYEIHGRGDFSLQVIDPNDPIENQDRIDIALSELSLNVLLYPTEWLRFQVEVELEAEEAEIEFDQIHGTITFAKGLPELRLGINYVPFGVEQFYYAPPRNPFINRPVAFRQIFPGTYPDLGVFVFGSYRSDYLPKINYSFSAVLGLQGPDRDDRRSTELRNINNFEDNNKDWQYSGRVGMVFYDNVDDASRTPLSLEIGLSFLSGIYDDEDRRRLSLGGLDIQLRVADFYFVGEHVRGKVELVDPAGTQIRSGTYYWLMYKKVLKKRFLESFHLAARFGLIDPDDRFRTVLDLERYSLVAGWEPYKNLLFKVQFDRTRERAEPFRRKRQALLVQVGFSF
ncbi:MAG: hypothetical protein P1V97_31125 [Planctomycetota bacterium]|nr:hypothetical protein [Planctomycetota bacterium]